MVLALRTVREGRGTLFVANASDLKSLGHPPMVPCRTEIWGQTELTPISKFRKMGHVLPVPNFPPPENVANRTPNRGIIGQSRGKTHSGPAPSPD
jgi:hypothetical protein